MKKLILIGFLFLYYNAWSQSIGSHIYEFKNKQLVQLITSIDTILYRNTDNLSVKLLRIYNPFGSAHLPETDEISIKYMVSVGVYDDIPRLFNLGDYIAPTLLKFNQINKDSFLVEIEHGIYAHRKKARYMVKLNSVRLIK
jgi:hypothetical protein